MNQSEINAYLATQGIAASSLSPDVRGALFEVLRAAGTQAIEQMTKLIGAEAARRGLDTITTESPETRAKKEQAAIEAALVAKQKADADRKRKILIGSVIGGVILLIVGVTIWLRRHKNKAT